MTAFIASVFILMVKFFEECFDLEGLTPILVAFVVMMLFFPQASTVLVQTASDATLVFLDLFLKSP